ncbi:hypothetical protein LMG22037_00228 [Paraburkholderia phenoliruptrix]|uniref:Hydrogen cyanide synthase subunit HcnA n=1 Tax=Paraburkholderia phenoliruptrix TaxID=252970 RepID=A0A6J4ZZE1_9BURK|nr:(2Fe-2S)-binding protein [Paraburkholderia phenoliruptrix]CAB3640457.1 hypothetical protein LMG22037_00228 [Paraburkholderia phenoliruptrix]
MPSNLPSSPASKPACEPQFVRIAETGRAPLRFYIDGNEASALQGDTLLTAVLMQQRRVRNSEFSGAPRAGFCLIGACQDCWMRTEDGQRIRACSTLVTEGMRVLTQSRAARADATVAGVAGLAAQGDAP